MEKLPSRLIGSHWTYYAGTEKNDPIAEYGRRRDQRQTRIGNEKEALCGHQRLTAHRWREIPFPQAIPSH